MLTVSGLRKAFGGKTLFEDATLQVNRGDRVGLVGPNGAGKTTFLKLILGLESPDEGTVAFERYATRGFLPQESMPVLKETVLDIAMSGREGLADVRAGIREATAAHDDARLHELEDQFRELGGFEMEPRAKRVLSGLAFREKDFERPAAELSGGWVMRAHLARLLVDEPDLLILDEPTNHLDLQSLLWFQTYLKAYPGAILLISHDREFLNQLVGSIVEIRHSQLIRYRGNYDEYLVQRAAQEEQLLAAYKNQQREIGRLQEFADRFRAKASKASQAQSKLKQIERMDKIQAPVSDDSRIHFSFPQPQRSGLKVVTLSGIDFGYSADLIYRGLDFEAEREQKIVLTGPNGAGKSTLLKLLAGALTPSAGFRKLGHNVRDGYYAQYRTAMLRAERTVLEEALDTPQRITEQAVRTLLGAFLFSGDDVFKKVSVLSGGEKSRLGLVKLLLDPPNLLLMDEPTTHLDMASIDALIGALKQFEGTLVFISHDVYFIRQLANQVIHVEGGQLRRYPGDYQYYLDKSSATSPQSSSSAPVAKQAAAPQINRRDQKRQEAEERQKRSQGKRDQIARVHTLEREVSTAEAKRRELVAELESQETYEKPGRAQQVNRELVDLEKKISELTHAWEQAATRLAEMEVPKPA